MKDIMIQKLTSRKFLALVVALVIAVMVILNVPEELQVQITALIGAFFSVVAYIFGEAMVDAERVKKE